MLLERLRNRNEHDDEEEHEVMRDSSTVNEMNKSHSEDERTLLSSECF